MTETSREAGKAAATRYYKRGKARLLIAQLADHGIRALDDSSMPATYHAARAGRPLDLDEGGEIKGAKHARPDKPQGSLWTAPGRTDPDGSVKSSWTDYDAVEGGSRRPAKSLYVVRPQPGAVIVSIETPEDAEALMGRYEAQDSVGHKAFDWVAMKRDGIDGVYVSPDAVQGNLQHQGTAFENLYAWDASSVAWLSNSNLSVDERQVEGGTYTVTHDDNDPMESRRASDERMGEYETPQRPELDGAWDRVPKKVRESKAAETGLPPSTGSQDNEKATSARKAKTPKPKEYTEGTPKEYSLLDGGKDAVEYLRGILERDEKKQEKAS